MAGIFTLIFYSHIKSAHFYVQSNCGTFVIMNFHCRVSIYYLEAENVKTTQFYVTLHVIVQTIYQLLLELILKSHTVY